MDRDSQLTRQQFRALGRVRWIRVCRRVRIDGKSARAELNRRKYLSKALPSPSDKRTVERGCYIESPTPPSTLGATLLRGLYRRTGTRKNPLLGTVPVGEDHVEVVFDQ
jgi:hypothetical protein